MLNLALVLRINVCAKNPARTPSPEPLDKIRSAHFVQRARAAHVLSASRFANCRPTRALRNYSACKLRLRCVTSKCARPLPASLKDDTARMNDRNKHKVTGQMNQQTADPKANASVFLFFPTAHFFKTILANRINGTFGFARHKPTLRKTKRAIFCQRTEELC